MILVINVCAEKLHYYEFVKPVEDILKKVGADFFTRHYLDIKKGDMMNAKKIIICGTSLRDNKFIQDVNYFSFMNDEKFSKSVLGICAGFQVIGMVSELSRQVSELDIKKNAQDVLKKHLEIGYFHENFDKEFLGLKDDQEVYHLHNNYVIFPDDFEKFTTSKVPQAIKHKEKEIYGTLFHPEVRNKEMILEFVKK